jgi:uncharacterized GH25 family protein
MKRKLIFLLVCIALTTNVATAHDLFLKLNEYVVEVNSSITVRLLSGSFTLSENTISRERMSDVSIVSPSGAVTRPTDSDWQDVKNTTMLALSPTEEGTHILGLSTKTREITLKAKEFNDYLSHDGIPDTLATRKRKGELKKGVTERYSKYVKAIFQVGTNKTDSYKRPLGYAVEIVPQQNPYDMKVGQTLEVLCLKDGKPLVNQFIMAGREFNKRVIVSSNTRTDSKGIAKIRLQGKGKWYVKFIQMTRLDEPQLDYESKWATLTFEIKK